MPKSERMIFKSGMLSNKTSLVEPSLSFINLAKDTGLTFPRSSTELASASLNTFFCNSDFTSTLVGLSKAFKTLFKAVG